MKDLNNIKYTEKMKLGAAELGVDERELFPIFRARNKPFIVNTTIEYFSPAKDYKYVYVYDINGDLHKVPHKNNAAENDPHKRMLENMANILIELNNNIVATEKEPQGFYIIWADMDFYEIRYFPIEELFLNGRVFHVIGQGRLKMATDQINIIGRIANVVIALGVIALLVLFYMLFIKYI